MKERAYAKINLSLDVVGEREDGYHELKMIMVPIDFYDVVEMNITDKETTLSLNKNYLPVDEKNTIIKAIKVLRDAYGFKENFSIVLSKHIPTQAGLAGGSADGAAAMRIMNKMLHLNMSKEDFIRYGNMVGSDVPFCCINKPALVSGTGDKIDTFPCASKLNILLVKPRRGVSTKVAFTEMDKEHAIHPDCEAMRKALMENDYDGIMHNLGNSLEEISCHLVKEIQDAKDALIGYGFDGVLMSGSGSTVFAITKDKDLLRKASEEMKKRGYFTRITSIL